MEVFNRNNSKNTGQLPILTSWMLISPNNSPTKNLSVQISEVPAGSEQPIHNHEPEQCYYIILLYQSATDGQHGRLGSIADG